MLTEGNVNISCGEGLRWAAAAGGCLPKFAHTGNTLNPTIIFGSQVFASIFFMTLINYGRGEQTSQFWSKSGGCCWLQPTDILIGVFTDNNQKTPFYNMLTNLLLNVSPATTFSRVRRLNFVLGPPTPPAISSQAALPPSSAGSLFGYYYGTPGLITIPWSEYVYRTNPSLGVYGPVTTFSQTAWTIVAQFYVQTDATASGNLFPDAGRIRQSAGDDQPRSRWRAYRDDRWCHGNHGLHRCRQCDVEQRHHHQEWHDILCVLQRQSSAVDHGDDRQRGTRSTGWIIPSSETIASDVILSTLDVYESNSIITGTAALEAASTFVGSNSITYAQFAAFNPTPPSGTAPVVTLLSPQPNIASPVTNGSNVTNVNAPFGSSGAVTYSATCGGVACTGTNAITSWNISSQSRLNAYSITSAGVLQGGSAASGIGSETDTFTISATNSTGTSPGVVQTVNAGAYIVASNAGSGTTCTLASPCSISEAQIKAQGAAFKTILLRSGTYNMTTGTKATSADNGETWAYYGPDGVGNAVWDFTGRSLTSPSTSHSLGTNTQKAVGFWISGGNNITLNGFTIQNFPANGVAVVGGVAQENWWDTNPGPAHGNTVENMTILNGNGGGPPFNVGDGQNANGLFSTEGVASWALGDIENTLVTHNNIQNMQSGAIVMQGGAPGTTGATNSTVSFNYIQNANIAGSDSGCIHLQVVNQTTTGWTFTNNYIRDCKSTAAVSPSYPRDIRALYAPTMPRQQSDLFQ